MKRPLSLAVALLAGCGGETPRSPDVPAVDAAKDITPADARPDALAAMDASVDHARDEGGGDAPRDADGSATRDLPALDAPSGADAAREVAVAPDAALDAVVSRDAARDLGPEAPLDAPGVPEAGVASLLGRTEFEAMFLHRGTAPCRGAFYTYAAFVAAAATFPTFAAEGTSEQRRRELAAFLANIGHETTGGWPTAPDGPYAWGLCWITEGATVPDSALPAYCDASSTRHPCRPGRKYYGRGPIQLSWNYNYGQAGDALGLPLLDAPERVADDAVVAFRTALWFWMTAQAPKPSCHAVMTGAYTPSAADLTAGRRPGFGLTINIINGGLECGRPTPAQVSDRVGYFLRFTSRLGVTPGDNLTCESMRSY